MANEAVLLVQKTIPESITVSDVQGIEKGTLLAYADPNTVSAGAADLDLVAGILYVEKIAGSGITQASVVVGPGDVFKMFGSGTIAIGDPVGPIAAFPNFVRSLESLPNLSGQRRLGFAREASTNGQSLAIELNRGGI